MGVAYIGLVVGKEAIPGADKIEALTVHCGDGGTWHGVAQKEQFELNSFCEVYLPDAILPQTDRFKFMSDSKYRVRFRRMRGCPSECLIMPIDLSRSGLQIVGDPIPGIEKYEKPVPANLHGEKLGSFPTRLVPKNDEPNFQTAPHLVNAMAGQPYYATVKLDGSSATFYRHKGHFGVCSRNQELKYNPDNTLWQLAEKYNLSQLIPEGEAIQAEICGPKIQDNPLGLSAPDMFVFNWWSIKERRYLSSFGWMEFCDRHKIPHVPIVDLFGANSPLVFPKLNHAELLDLAEGKYPNGSEREGVVIRPTVETYIRGERLSFKIINLKYKDRE